MTVTDASNDNDLAARLVSVTRDLVLIPSCAGRPQDLERGAGFVRNHLDTLEGVKVDAFACEGFPSIVARPEAIQEPEILLFAHVDVVAHPELDVYRSTVGDGRIRGPGAGDMKGQMAILLDLFRHFHTRHPGISLGFAVTSDEEQGGSAGARYLFEEVALRCGEVIIPDGGSLNKVVVEEKGILHLKVRCQGRPGHAAYPWRGDNPVEKLMQRLGRVQEFFAECKRPDSGGHWYPTCSITRLHTPDEAVNLVPPWAEAALDIRFPPPWTLEAVLAELKGRLGADIEQHVMLGDDPSRLKPSALFLQVTEEVTGAPAELVRASGGSDARFICKQGIPVIVSRPLVGDLHTESEWIDIQSMEAYHQILKAYIERRLLGGALSGPKALSAPA